MASFRDQLLDAAKKAAIEATTNERARCLWAADQVIKELEVKVERKIFATTVEIEAAKMKLKIARAVVVELRRAIVSGARPPGVRGEPGPAGISAEADPPEGEPVAAIHPLPSSRRPFATCPHTGGKDPCPECSKDLARKMSWPLPSPNICPKCGEMGHRYNGSCPHCDDLKSPEMTKEQSTEQAEKALKMIDEMLDQPVHFCAICGDQIEGEHNCGGVGLRSE